MSNFSDLLSASCAQGDLSYVKSVDPWALTELEQQGRDWALALLQHHGAPPTLDMLKQHPDHRVLVSNQHLKTDLRLLFGVTIDTLVKRKIDMELSGLSERASLEDAYPLDELSKLVRKARGMSSADRAAMLSFDLDQMFDLSGMVNGLTLGLEGIDSAISFLLPGEFMVLAARLGTGKSIITCYLAARWARFGKKVLVVSCEMLPEQLMHRIYAIFGGFNPKLFRMPQMALELASHMGDVRAKLAEVKTAGGDIIFPRDRALTMDALETAIIEEEPDVVLVDGLYLLKPARMRTDSAKWETTMASSNGLKQLSMEYSVPMFGTTQFKRTDKTSGFGPEDIAYSDAIGQDADMIVALSRDDSDPLQHILVGDLIKNRAGEMGARSQISVNWDKMEVVDKPFTRTKLVLNPSGATP